MKASLLIVRAHMSTANSCCRQHLYCVDQCTWSWNQTTNRHRDWLRHGACSSRVSMNSQCATTRPRCFYSSLTTLVLLTYVITLRDNIRDIVRIFCQVVQRKTICRYQDHELSFYWLSHWHSPHQDICDLITAICHPFCIVVNNVSRRTWSIKHESRHLTLTAVKMTPSCTCYTLHIQGQIKSCRLVEPHEPMWSWCWKHAVWL